MIEPAGDHLGYYYRTGLCAGVGEFAIAGETFGAARKALGDRTIRTYQDPVRMMTEFRPRLVVVSMRSVPASLQAVRRNFLLCRDTTPA